MIQGLVLHNLSWKDENLSIDRSQATGQAILALFSNFSQCHKMFLSEFPPVEISDNNLSLNI